jgi:hypothetical protein
MFASIYVLLFIVWIFVLHQKISAGPDPPGAATTKRGGALEAATSRASHRQ